MTFTLGGKTIYVFNKASKSHGWPFRLANGRSINILVDHHESVQLSVYLFTTNLALEFHAGDDIEDTLCFRIGVPFLFSVYLSIGLANREWMKRLFYFHPTDVYKQSRSWGFYYFHESKTLYCKLGGYQMMSSSDDPWYYDFQFNFVRFLFGRLKTSVEIISNGTWTVEMPEKNYDATYKVENIVHKRKRWFTKRYTRVEINIPEGIPHPGKGTTDYNCGDDRTYSLSIPGKDVATAVSALSKEVLRMRGSYPL